jgi:hypothetical protein
MHPPRGCTRAGLLAVGTLDRRCALEIRFWKKFNGRSWRTILELSFWPHEGIHASILLSFRPNRAQLWTDLETGQMKSIPNKFKQDGLLINVKVSSVPSIVWVDPDHSWQIVRETVGIFPSLPKRQKWHNIGTLGRLSIQIILVMQPYRRTAPERIDHNRSCDQRPRAFPFDALLTTESPN